MDSPPPATGKQAKQPKQQLPTQQHKGCSSTVQPKLAARRPDWELPQLHAGLELASLEPLHATKRSTCPTCQRSRAHYCYDCLQALTPGVPHVALPFRVSIVTHHEERASKNTGVQVAILAAGQVDLHSMDNVPQDVDPSRCAVLFPSDTALDVEELEPDSVDRLFIIDSRWKKAGELVRSEVFQRMRAVRLSETRSAFWRFHTRGVADEGVCTVEALFFFLKALAQHGKLTDPRFTQPHAFDNLLYYFTYQHQVVQQAAQRRQQQQQAAQGQQQEGEQQGQQLEQEGQQGEQGHIGKDVGGSGTPESAGGGQQAEGQGANAGAAAGMGCIAQRQGLPKLLAEGADALSGDVGEEVVTDGGVGGPSEAAQDPTYEGNSDGEPAAKRCKPNAAG